jgi:GT2 family glycosyltransferase
MASTYPNIRIIVADNGSSDDSVSYLKLNFPSIEILTHSLNEGFAGGYNWALKEVNEDYYVLLNSDVCVPPGWIEPVMNILLKEPFVAACQPKILSYQQPELFEYAGAGGGWIDSLGYPFSKGRIFDVCEADNGQYDEVQRIFWASGAAMFVRAKVFHELGGFDASFFAHQEEIDLCWRMQLAGYKILSCPASTVYHLGAGTLPRGGRKVYLNFRNNLLMLRKNLPFQEKIWKIPFRFALDAISAWKGLFTGDFAFFMAIFKAHLSVLKSFFTTRVISQKPPKSMITLHGVYSGSVVWHYFIKKHTRFMEIVSKKTQ